MTDYENREPFVSDQRLERIETLVRLAHPELPDAAQFATARIEEEGRAHFVLISPVPGIPDPFRMVATRKVPFDRFEKFEKEVGHHVSGDMKDPVQWIFESLTADLLPRLQSAAEMNHPTED